MKEQTDTVKEIIGNGVEVNLTTNLDAGETAWGGVAPDVEMQTDQGGLGSAKHAACCDSTANTDRIERKGFLESPRQQKLEANSWAPIRARGEQVDEGSVSRSVDKGESRYSPRWMPKNGREISSFRYNRQREESILDEDHELDFQDQIPKFKQSAGKLKSELKAGALNRDLQRARSLGSGEAIFRKLSAAETLLDKHSIDVSEPKQSSPRIVRTPSKMSPRLSRALVPGNRRMMSDLWRLDDLDFETEEGQEKSDTANPYRPNRKESRWFRSKLTRIGNLGDVGSPRWKPGNTPSPKKRPPMASDQRPNMKRVTVLSLSDYDFEKANIDPGDLSSSSTTSDSEKEENSTSTKEGLSTNKDDASSSEKEDEKSETKGGGTATEISETGEENPEGEGVSSRESTRHDIPSLRNGDSLTESLPAGLAPLPEQKKILLPYGTISEQKPFEEQTGRVGGDATT